MKKLLGILLLAALFAACSQESKSPKAVEEDMSASIFQLNSSWQNQDGKEMKLKDLQGKTLVVVMIYTSCKTACPLLVGAMKKIESQVSPKNLEKTSFVLVSIDPNTDTPARLKSFAKENNMTAPQWVFLRSSENNTQEFANVLAMKYKKISPMDFSHSNIITIFSPNGTMQLQEEGLNINTEKVAAEVDEVVSKYN